jgi:hypothetical protein
VKLSEKIARLEMQRERGLYSEGEFLDEAAHVITWAVRDKANADKLFHVSISNNTKGAYRHGTTDHYLDTDAEVGELFEKWSAQDTMRQQQSFMHEGVEITVGIIIIDNDSHSTAFAVTRRDSK